ncbi:MAG: FRG domain-containing protein [Nitrospinae bacterium]|nr:FRG domain-containing protein [Nitrospinota bacterium]
MSGTVRGPKKRTIASKQLPVPQIDSLADLIKQISKWKEKYWWRGQPDGEKYKLVPGIFRKEEDENQESPKYALFKEMAPARYEKCPSENIEWMFLMQHYRLQTRLLDWTKSPLVAIFFAVLNSKKGQDSALWFLQPRELNRKMFPNAVPGEFLSSSDLIKPLYRGGFDRPHQHHDRVAAIMPRQLDSRMLLQLSRFTLHGSKKPLEEYDEITRYLHKLVIPWSKKQDIKTQLAYMGITASNLFPDLDHLANDLNQNIFEAF